MKTYKTLALGGVLALTLAACSSDMTYHDKSGSSSAGSSNSGVVRPSSSEGGNTGTSGSIGTSGTTPATTDTPPHQ